MVVLASGERGEERDKGGGRCQFGTANISREGLRTHQKIVNINYTPSALRQISYSWRDGKIIIIIRIKEE